MTRKEIAHQFSNGEFSSVMDYIADNAMWTIVGENKFEGKNEIESN